ncbi:MAG TPA: hypothetical protein VKT81_14585 [Bryobacteraceae bacterium]|nr:hypothetical protein [Bryobacteraceae bacterium]
MDHSAHSTPNGVGHETREISVRFIVVSLLILLAGTFLVAILVIGIFKFFSQTYQPNELAKQSVQQIPPQPRIEVEPFQQLIDVHAREEHVLNSYAWVDKSQGIVRIPIDKAIDAIAAKGLPTHDYLADITRKQNAAK